MRILNVLDVATASAALDDAALILQSGRLVAFPTETVYGLGAAALNPVAVARIYAAKGRPAWNPLIVHVASIEQARALSSGWNDRAEQLGRAFWPGPLTLVVPKRPDIPDSVTAGLPSVAIRVPAHPIAAALLERVGIPLAAPSANRSTGISPTRAEHVAAALGASVDLILDGGPTAIGIESTVVDVQGDTVKLLRPGGISRESLEKLVEIESPVPVAEGEARSSPGQMLRHYAPAARISLFAAGDTDVDVAVRAARLEGARAGALLRTTEIHGLDFVMRMPHDAMEYAARLYDALHEADRLAIDVLFVESVPDSMDWEAVRDRLSRASASGAA